MKYGLYVTFLILAASCKNILCEESVLQGEAAKAAIVEYEPFPPEAVMVIPDSTLSSSTKEVEDLLIALKMKGLLNYALLDSSVETRTLKGKSLNRPGNTWFYHYKLEWTPSLEAFNVKEQKKSYIRTSKLLGRKFKGELKFGARHLLTGKVSIQKGDSLYYRKDCKQISYKYTYTMGAQQPLAVMAGLPSLVKSQRIVNVSLGK